MPDHFIEIYAEHADRYHQLIAAEDVDGNLARALGDITDLRGKRILDIGSGSGRIPILLRGLEGRILGVDLYRDMLRQQQGIRGEAGNWELTQADLRRLPVATGWADVVSAGWAIGHFCGWYGAAWKGEAKKAVNEMMRAVRPEGSLIIMETMGTGVEQAGPPTPTLADYYRWLEERGFVRQVISTDYEFGSIQRAADLCGFFFGEEMAEKISQRGSSRVPEWTGIWHKALI